MASKKTENLHNALAAVDDIVPPLEACKFVHLHSHSAFSLLEGALPLKELIELAVADNQPAIAVTDRNNLFGALEFSEKAVKEGLQPIMGCKLAIDFQDGKDAQARSGLIDYPFLVLLATSETGFDHIRKLVSSAHLGDHGAAVPHITLQQLGEHAEDVICLTGGSEGPLYRIAGDQREEDARARARVLKNLFGDRLYIELQRHDALDRTDRTRVVKARL